MLDMSWIIEPTSKKQTSMIKNFFKSLLVLYTAILATRCAYYYFAKQINEVLEKSTKSKDKLVAVQANSWKNITIANTAILGEWKKYRLKIDKEILNTIIK